MKRPEISLIVAQSNNRVIGRNNTMPWHLPKDLKWFKSQTEQHAIVMGSNTYRSIGRALPKRRNIVISSAPAAEFPDAEVVRSLDEAIALLSEEARIFIIGGAQLYESAIERADSLVVTHIDTTIDDGDRFFPAIDPNVWHCTSEESTPADEANPYHLRFCTYRRIK
ncbi:dihydrofolate reductase [Suttonella sp. R2A3]|uniref:dihydrofolate reductase n=1 Tax=Suttonella sp. R2A3 TaxID=2908648 RepID=UPI001F3254E3|nr:dihydrofolate reductase [Suttonella sp. R2A3]UJF24113.1 dihydrofolate reductase [Suttonella sp. R2A3]